MSLRLLASLPLALVAVPLRADVSVLTADDHAFSAVSFSITPDRKISFTLPDGATRSVSVEDVVEIAAEGAPPRDPAAGELRAVFTNGDVLTGAAGSAGAYELAVASPSLGAMTVPFDQLDAVLVVRQQRVLPRVRPETRNGDLLLRPGGDRITGLLKSLGPGGAAFEVEGREIAVPLRDLAGVYLTRTRNPPAEPSALLATASARDGSAVTGVLVAATPQAVAIQSLYPAAGGDAPRGIVLPMPEFSALSFRNGRCVYLSDLEPANVEEHALLEPAEAAAGDLLSAFPFPFQRDRAVDPERLGPLSLRGRVYRKGLGVHSRSVLTWDLGGRYRRFLSAIGIDDETAGRGSDSRDGSVIFQVWTDGRRAFDSGNVTARDPARAVDVSMAGVRELRLVVDFGDDYDVLDHADWAGARLIR